MNDLDYAIKRTALNGRLDECGDIGFVCQDGDSYLLTLVDVLGHGPEAGELAVNIEEIVRSYANKSLEQILVDLNQRIIGSRGAVMAMVRLDRPSGRLDYVGIGNITSRIKGNKESRLVPRDGVVGYGSVHPKCQTYWLNPGDVLIMYSDGLHECFSLTEDRYLWYEPADVIAIELMNKQGKGNDDQSVLVMKYDI